MQWFVNKIFSRETQRPSGVKLWQMLLPSEWPKPPGFGAREDPLLAQETSYLAASARIASFD